MRAATGTRRRSRPGPPRIQRMMGMTAAAAVTIDAGHMGWQSATMMKTDMVECA